MPKNVRILPYLFLTTVVAGVMVWVFIDWVRNQDHGRPGLHLSSSLILSEDEIKAKEKAARNGDGTAAYHLYLHYSAGLNEMEEADKWLRLAAHLGDEPSKELLEYVESNR